MAAKETPEKETSKASAKVEAEVGGVQAKASVKGGRRTLGIVGCVVLALVVCCVASLAVFWFTGDSILDIMQNYLQ